jgi:hypothetical protein
MPAIGRSLQLVPSQRQAARKEHAPTAHFACRGSAHGCGPMSNRRRGQGLVSLCFEAGRCSLCTQCHGWRGRTATAVPDWPMLWRVAQETQVIFASQSPCKLRNPGSNLDDSRVKAVSDQRNLADGWQAQTLVGVPLVSSRCSSDMFCGIDSKLDVMEVC